MYRHAISWSHSFQWWQLMSSLLRGYEPTTTNADFSSEVSRVWLTPGMSNMRPFASTRAARTKDTVIWSFNGQNCSFYNFYKFATRIMAMYGSTYVCEQLFSFMKSTKTSQRTRLTDQHLSSLIKVGTARTFQPDIPKIATEKRCQASWRNT